MQKIKLFTHTDLDGIGCAIVGKLWAEKYKYDIDISFCDNNQIDGAVTKFLNEAKDSDFYRVFITDLSVNESLAAAIDIIDGKHHRYELYDHHLSALPLNKYSWVKVVPKSEEDIFECGTSLFYKALFKDELGSVTRLSQFVNAVRLWDTWQWQLTDDKHPQLYNTMLKLKGKTAFIESMMPSLSESIQLPANWEVEFEESEAAKEAYIKEALERVFYWQSKSGDLYACVVASSYISELGNRIAAMNLDCVASIILTEHSISLRAVREDVDVSKLAASLGGGGHAHAAGFNVSESKMQQIMSIIMEE